jgi:hypothetical protein
MTCMGVQSSQQLLKIHSRFSVMSELNARGTRKEYSREYGRICAEALGGSHDVTPSDVRVGDVGSES